MTTAPPVQEAITGHEQRPDTGDPLSALTEFYRAINSRNLALMQQNWTNTDEATMDNPLGGIKRGWTKSVPYTRDSFAVMEPTISSSMTIACTASPRFFISLDVYCLRFRQRSQQVRPGHSQHGFTHHGEHGSLRFRSWKSLPRRRGRLASHTEGSGVAAGSVALAVSTFLIAVCAAASVEEATPRPSSVATRHSSSRTRSANCSTTVATRSTVSIMANPTERSCPPE